MDISWTNIQTTSITTCEALGSINPPCLEAVWYTALVWCTYNRERGSGKGIYHVLNAKVVRLSFCNRQVVIWNIDTSRQIYNCEVFHLNILGLFVKRINLFSVWFLSSPFPTYVAIIMVDVNHPDPKRCAMHFVSFFSFLKYFNIFTSKKL